MSFATNNIESQRRYKSTATSVLLKAREGQFFRSKEHEALLERLRGLVERGEVDASVLESATKKFSSSTTYVTEKEFERFEYVKGVTKVPRRIRTGELHGSGLGTQVNMGRMRWTSDGVSIFSVADGKELASTEPKALNRYENIRMQKIQRAALESPTVLGGYRVLPEMTPGRALMWGTIVAVWGTGALVMSTARYLGIEELRDVPGRMKDVLSPLGESLKSWVMYGSGVGGSLGGNAVVGVGDERSSSMVLEFAARLKERYQA
jgi:hypothetical protein